MEEDKKVDSKKVTSSVHQRHRPNRSFVSRLTHNSGGNSFRHRNREHESGSSDMLQRNSSNVLPPIPSNSEGASASGAENSSSTLDNPNRIGLNSIRQMLEEADTQVTSFDEMGSISRDGQNSGSSISDGVRNRNASPTSHRGERHRGRRRIQTHPNPEQSRVDTFVRNASPMRHTRHYRANDLLASPLQFPSPHSSSSSAASPTDGTSNFVDGLFGNIGQLGPFPNPYLQGYGTEEDPFLLSPDSPTESDHQGNLQSDEEIARQLQQEEWEAASGFSGRTYNPRPPRNGAYAVFNHPHRRVRAPDLPPLRITRSMPSSRSGQNSSGEGSNQHFGSSPSQSQLGSSVFRPPGHRRRSQEEPLPVRIRLEHWANPPDDFDDGYSNMSLLTDLLGSYDLADIESMMHPGTIGQRHLLNLDYMDYESLLELGEQLGDVSKGLEQSEIDKLNICVHDTSLCRNGATAASPPESPQCNICLSDYDNGDEKRVLPCKHEFHKHCVDQWLQTNATCPICRSDVRRSGS